MVEGAHTGKGLGIRFLKHTERTRLLVHLLDFSAENKNDPLADYYVIRNELKRFSKELYQKPEILAASKVDTPGAEEKFAEHKPRLLELNPILLSISSVTSKGIYDLLKQIQRGLSEGRVDGNR